MKSVEEINKYAVSAENSSTQVNIGVLINQLAAADDSIRENARLSLVKLGKPAVHPLIRAMTSHDQVVRWEAAEGLIHIGSDVTVPLLQALISNSKSFQLREGAHHVLNHLTGGDRSIEHHTDHHGPRSGIADILEPVVKALEDRAPSVRVPTAAQNALDKMKT